MNLLKSLAVVFTLAAAVTGVGFMSNTVSATNQNCVSTVDRSKVTGRISSTTPYEATVEYKGAALCDGAKLTVSFNSYATEGPTWATSGKQTLLDHQQVVISKSNTKATLKVKAAPCYYQTDLYFGSTKFDGVDGPLPHYPTAVIHPTGAMIDFRNGGNACKPNPEKSEKTEDRKDCEKGVEKRTITTTVDYKLENSKWIKQAPVVTTGEWKKVRDLTEQEKTDLKCVTPETPEVLSETTETPTELPKTGAATGILSVLSLSALAYAAVRYLQSR